MARHRHSNRAGQCQVCRHPERLRIESARLAGASFEATAAKFGVHRDALWRHMHKHVDADRRAMLIADVSLKDLAQKAADEGVSLLEYLALVRSTVMNQMVAAASVNDRNATANLARASTEVLREIGRLTGELIKTGPVTNVTQNVAVFMASPAYSNLEAMLVRKLQPHPAALQAVLEGLAELQAPPPSQPPDGPGAVTVLPPMREVSDARRAA